MIKKDRQYFEAVAVMIGYTIGAGMFSLPFIFAKAGIFAFLFYLFFLGAVQYLIHLAYANIIIITETFHRLPGYVGIYLGKTGKSAVFLAKFFGNIGALLAYLLLSGTFLFELLSPAWGGTEFFYTSVLFCLGALIVFYGIETIAKVELVMTGLLFLIVFLIAFKGLPVIRAENFSFIDWKYIFLPYGAMLFALDGVGSLPMIGKILKKEPARMKSVIRTSISISMLITAVFTFSVIGVSGMETTPDALVGIRTFIGSGVVGIALLFGIFTMATSFFGVAEALKETLWWDYGMNKNLSWAISVFSPFLLYLLGFQDFIGVVGFIGGIAGGFSAFMLVLVFLHVKKKSPEKLILFKKIPGLAISLILMSLFILGLVYEVVSFF